MSEQAVIVYNKKEAKYAHLMAQLISAYTEYEIVEWEDKDWLANKASSSSSEKIIFLGATGSNYKIGTKWSYDKFCMRYGWLGNKCVFEVKSIPAKEVKDFKEFYEKRAAHFEVKASQKRVDGKPFLVAAVPFLLLPFGIPIGIVTYAVAKAVGNTAKYTEHQYQLLVNEFVLEGGLKKFMEE